MGFKMKDLNQLIIKFDNSTYSMFRCDYDEKLDCEPQDCETQPLVKRMLENLR